MKYLQIIIKMHEACIDPTASNAAKDGFDYLLWNIIFTIMFFLGFYLLLTIKHLASKWRH